MTAKTSILNRAVISAAAVALVAGSAGAASAQSYRQPTGGGVGSVVNCDAPGGRQAVGAVIGALVGGALGSNLAKHDRGTGTAIGAVAGAAGGSYLGCKQQRDRVNQGQAYGYGNGGYGSQPTAYNRPYDRSFGGAYVAGANLNVRSAPSASAARVGAMGAGQSFQALGRDGDWIVVSNGSSLGYVHGGYVRPAGAGYQRANYGY